MEKEPNGITIKKFEGSKAKEFIQTHNIELNMPGLFIETHGEY